MSTQPIEYGTIAVVPMGEFDFTRQYEVANLVSLDGSSYIAHTKPPVGTEPTNTDYWQVSAIGTNKATEETTGVVKPDGTTTEVDENGVMSVKVASQTTAGIVKGSDDINVEADGALSVNTTFEQAVELANIITGEAIASVLGKVSKAIAKIMSLDSNALLKNMLSGIDANDPNKVPTSAYIHTLVERIGMGTQLTAGANLTEAANNLSSNFDNLETALNSVLKTQWTSNSNEITVGPGSTVTAQFPTARIAGFVPIGIVGFSVKAGLTVYQCNTDTTNYTTNVYVRNDTASNIVNTSGQISALVLYAKTFR